MEDVLVGLVVGLMILVTGLIWKVAHHEVIIKRLKHLVDYRP